MAATEDLTHAEARDAFKALAREMGANAEVSVGLHINSYSIDKAILAANIWPEGLIGNGLHLSVKADTYRELLEAAEAEWAVCSDLHASNTIRKMALAIIEITADLGECTDAALRAKFDGADVTRYGDRACEAATEMASNGPFSIVKLSGANDIAA